MVLVKAGIAPAFLFLADIFEWIGVVARVIWQRYGGWSIATRWCLDYCCVLGALLEAIQCDLNWF